MSLAPDYRLVEAALGDLESGGDARLLNAVYTAIDLILDQHDSAAARRGLVHSNNGRAIRIVSVADPRHDWSVLWWLEGDIAVFAYIGAWPIR